VSATAVPNRRQFLATLSSAAAGSLFGGASLSAQEAPPETSTIRLIRNAGICIAPQYVADELLRAEGFTDIQYVMRSPAFMCRRGCVPYDELSQRRDLPRSLSCRMGSHAAIGWHCTSNEPTPFYRRC
jgi:hypothetical protein